MPPKKGVVDLLGSSSSDDEPLVKRRVEAPRGSKEGAGNDNKRQQDVEEDGGSSDMEELFEDDDEQAHVEGTEDKEIEAVLFKPGDPHSATELKELVIQDLKTEDPSERGGFARRRVGKGSVVLVRGEDSEGTTVTWVAMVEKLYRKRGQYLADIHWFYRKPDVPSSAVPRRAML
ncbi:hypothetical protein CHLNCDRAFT_143106, partial [Chlorella variabilis]